MTRLTSLLRTAAHNLAGDAYRAQSARARASQRAAVYRATATGAKALLGLAAFDAIVLTVLHPSGTPIFLVAGAILAGGAFASLRALPGFRRRPELVAFLLALLAGVTARVVARVTPEAATLMMGYLLLVPGALAILIPWRTVTHLRWMAIFGITSVVFLAGPLARGPATIDQADQVVAVALSVAFSLLGHLLAQRSRLRYGAQLERGRILRHQTIRQRAEISHLYAELLNAARFDPLTEVGN